MIEPGVFRAAKRTCLVFHVTASLRTRNSKPNSNFPFEIISDSDEELCKLFGVLKQKSMFGRKYFGIERSTFLFDAHGVLRHEWRKVKVLGHAEEVLRDSESGNRLA